MLIQSANGIKLPMADVALPETTVKSPIVSRVRDILFLVPRDLFAGNSAVGVSLTDHAVDGFTIQSWSSRAGCSLQMMGETSGGRVVAFAERTGDSGATMDLGVEML